MTTLFESKRLSRLAGTSVLNESWNEEESDRSREVIYGVADKVIALAKESDNFEDEVRTMLVNILQHLSPNDVAGLNAHYSAIAPSDGEENDLYGTNF